MKTRKPDMGHTDNSTIDTEGLREARRPEKHYENATELGRLLARKWRTGNAKSREEVTTLVANLDAHAVLVAKVVVTISDSLDMGHRADFKAALGTYEVCDGCRAATTNVGPWEDGRRLCGGCKVRITMAAPGAKDRLGQTVRRALCSGSTKGRGW